MPITSIPLSRCSARQITPTLLREPWALGPGLYVGVDVGIGRHLLTVMYPDGTVADKVPNLADGA
jgi:hypothetical protein